ncbi:reverse transcriptase family protein [Bosea robiniae]|uniref:Reverse transcriptase (RNA-dependent DNA polymerase) n=1 Tax=Bosea robiniae TaxID=1036780 RepID=A0ABY0P3Z8_9HYPH|nr:reverse transcriptase family protein [Bosea robiniae]SDH19981.1 Reverse transcriptase (RNA-dependent DNA polymerase) [Bosea robiniae]
MPIKRTTHDLGQSSLYRLVRRRRLGELLDLTDAQLRYLTKYADTLYRESDVPKKNGDGTRHIEDPAKLLKQAQSRLATLLSRITPPEFLFCPVKRRCYVTNAAQHRGHRVVRSLDIHKYFPNTTSRRVFWFFSSVMKCDRSMAGTLTKLACYREHLPTGSPLSPIMAFFAHYDMWNEIAAICRREGLTLTVYVDDVTVSGDKVSESLVWEIRQAIHRSGLRHHKEKAFYDRPAEITGVIVTAAGIEVPHKQFRKLRLAVAAAKEAGSRQTKKAQEKLDGLKGQLAQIQKVSATLQN